MGVGVRYSKGSAMKTKIITLALLICLPLVTRSQELYTLPIETVRKLVEDAYKLRNADSLNAVLESDNERLKADRDRMVEAKEELQGSYDAALANCDSMIVNRDKQIVILSNPPPSRIGLVGAICLGVGFLLGVFL